MSERFDAAPLVAVSGRYVEPGRVSGWRDPACAIQTAYLDAIRRAGALPGVVDPIEADAATAGDLVGRFDALVLTGGADVDPSLYGQARHPRTYGTHVVSDRFEIALLHAALERGLPVLAICRGLQVVNVAFGGTLEQHLPDRPGLQPHGRPGVAGEAGAPQVHPVEIEPGSLLADELATTRVQRCSSHHHQAVDTVGSGLVVVARAPDGVVEGLEIPGAWLLAVQWHPEDTAAHDPAQQRCFDALAARARRDRPGDGRAVKADRGSCR